ncbi:hypothetical protein GDO78_000794 [Eleutherodactylus coqui]|uniref:Uncharacterized protein n=1 Tax=Eleutherodactylus coqui TaxID=57060 RepID=A0A8J6FRH7_ELECQ|nr:hypothetical protein GDO78_000794 [Eleutherodactylus coqui]
MVWPVYNLLRLTHYICVPYILLAIPIHIPRLFSRNLIATVNKYIWSQKLALILWSTLSGLKFWQPTLYTELIMAKAT